VTDYGPVQKALAEGADPAMLCATCPWDRTCLTPPTMTKAEVDAKIAEATDQEDKRLAEARASGKDGGFPVGAIMTALIFGGKEQSASICPVFALRLRSSGGRRIADDLKASMQGWDDQS
jgi:hypothetical protein